MKGDGINLKTVGLTAYAVKVKCQHKIYVFTFIGPSQLNGLSKGREREREVYLSDIVCNKGNSNTT
jgi:hypothetical protein